MEEPHDRGMIFEAAVLKYLHQLAVAEPVQRLEADAEILFKVLAAYIRVGNELFLPLLDHLAVALVEAVELFLHLLRDEVRERLRVLVRDLVLLKQRRRRVHHLRVERKAVRDVKLVRLRLCAAYVIVTISLLIVTLAAVSGLRVARRREAGNIRTALLRVVFIGRLRLSCRRRILRAVSGVSIVRTR